MVNISRRQFLLGSGAGALLAACGKTQTSRPFEVEPNTDHFGLAVSSNLVANSSPQRFAFAWAEGTTLAGGPAAKVALVDPTGKSVGTIEPQYRSEGLAKGRGIYVADTVFGASGIWNAKIEVGGNQATLPLEVKPTSVIPKIGESAPRAASPTLGKPLEVDPICTRETNCGLHGSSAHELQANGKPTILIFATPARCSSQYCGPVLELLLDASEPFRDQINFVHIEIYKAPQGPDTSPTFVDWSLESEPWMFGIDASNTIVTRLDGAFDLSEINETIEQLTG